MAKLYINVFKVKFCIAFYVISILLFAPLAKANTVSPILFKANFFQSNPTYSYKVIPASKNTWGYEITKNNKTIIKQLNIPAVPGTLGFKTKEDAAKVARLVVSKLKVKEDLPTISIQELKDLKVIPKK